MLRMTRMILVAVVLVSTFALPAAPDAPASVPAMQQTPPVVIDFDDLTTTTLGTGGQTVVSDQYAAQGVTFNDPKVLDYAGGNFGDPGFVHSGSNAIQHCYSEEFCDRPLVMTFTVPQQRVKVWAGFEASLDEALTVSITAFDAESGGDEVASASATLGPSDESAIPVQTPLEVAVDGATIRRVEVGFSPASDFASSLVFDDVEFETICSAVADLPIVALDQPTTGLSTQQNVLDLRGRVTSAVALDEWTVTTAGSGGIRSKVLPPNSIDPVSDEFAISIKDLLLPGTNTVTVAARNCAGLDTAGTVVTFEPLADDTRYKVLGLEVTQTVQNLDNRVPLIAGKRTFVRVYLQTIGSDAVIRNVSAALRVCHDPEGPRPACLADDTRFVSIRSYMGTTLDNLPDITTKRRKITSGLIFELPAEFTAVGELHLALDSLSLSPALPCDTCDSSTPAGGVSSYLFQKASPVRVNLVDVSYTVDGQTHAPYPVHRARLESWLQRAYPTNEIIRVSDIVDLPIESGLPTCQEVNDRLFADLKIVENQSPDTPLDPRTRYYALVSDAGGFMPGCVADTRVFATGPAGSGEAYSWDDDGSYADFYGGHELAHTFGRHHPGACDDNDRFDRESPVYPDGLIAEGEYMYFGFDAGDATIRENIIQVQPFEADLWTDLMTYCNPRWISSYTYQGILKQSNLENVPAPEEATDDVPALAAELPGQEVLLVAGTINLKTDSVELRPFSLLPGDNVTPRPTSSDFTIVLEDDGGADLETYPFAPRLYRDTPADADPTAQLGEVVPWHPDTKRISIRRLNQEIAFRTVTEYAPWVEITSPNGGELLQGASHTATWNAGDTIDNDPMTDDDYPRTYSLLYSTDDGVTWRSIASGIREKQYTVDLSRLPGSDTALYRVIATDGVNTGQDDSDAVFSVAPKAPEVGIVSPANGTSFGTSHTIVLVGTAHDVEQGNLDGAALQWSSDIDGALGAGRSISAKNLTPGFHTITLIATDDDGMSEVETLRIEIVDDDLPTLTWDPAIDISYAPQGHFSYDSDAGSGTVYTNDGAGGIQQLRSYDRLLNGWTAIVPGNFGGDDELTDLLLYSAQPGLGEFYASDGEGGLRLLSGAESFTKGWDFVVPGDFGGDDNLTDLFFYDLQEPVGKFYTTDGEGRIRLLGTSKALLTGWTSIVAGSFGGDGHTDLLFYDKEQGLARFYTVDGQGGVELLSEDPAWTKGWDQIVAGNFDDDGGTDLFFFDDETRTAKFFATDGEGGIEQLGATETLLSRWTTIIGGDFGGDDTLTDLFFYDKAGRGKFYTTDGSGGLDQLSSSDAFATGWDLIVAGHFAGS